MPQTLIFFHLTQRNGYFSMNRRNQNARFLRENFSHLILNDIEAHESLKTYLNELEKKLESGAINPGHAVDLLFLKYKAFLLSQTKND